jgi:TolB protein
MGTCIVLAGLLGCTMHHPSSPFSNVHAGGADDVAVADRIRLTFTEEEKEYAVGWHPNGYELAYIAYRGPLGRDGIYIGALTLRPGQPITQQPLIPLTQGSEQYGGQWSPDGTRFLFISNRTGDYDIWVANQDGTNPTQLTHDPTDDLYPTWSPDGKRIAFLSPRSGEIAIWMMNNDGSNPQQITAGGNGDWGTSWSPDGQKIVFGSIRTSAENKSKHVRLGKMSPISKEELLAEAVLMKNFFQTVLLAGIPSENLWVVDLKTKELTQLTRTHGHESYWHPVWSPDGTKIAFVSDREGNPDVWIMNADGSHQTRLTTEPTYDAFPVWSPDGSKLAYSSAPDSKGNFDIWMMTLTKRKG